MTSTIRKVLVGVTAAAVLAGSALTATSASANPWPKGPNHSYGQHYSSNFSNHRYYGNHRRYYGGGWGYDNGFGLGVLGFIAGAAVGSAVSNSYDDNSCYRFKTYNPQTGMYMSYNGPRHCP